MKSNNNGSWKVPIIMMVIIVMMTIVTMVDASTNRLNSIEKVSISVKKLYTDHYDQPNGIASKTAQLGKDVNKVESSTSTTKQIYPAPDKERTKLWVYFNTKNYNNENEKAFEMLTSYQPHHFLSQPSLDRRIRRSSMRSLMDERDVPVQQQLVEHVMRCGSGIDGSDKNVLTLHRSLKWINAVSVSMPTSADSHTVSDVLECITHYDFVERIELVNRFYRPPSQIKEEELEKRAQEIAKDTILSERGPRTRNTMMRVVLADKVGDNSQQAFYNHTYSGAVQINVPQTHLNGFNGSGVTILMLDSGYVKTHDAVKHLRFIDEYDFVDDQVNTQAPFGDPQNTHGTATLSTIAGYVPGIMVGPAYSADFLLAKTEDTRAEYVEEEDNWIAAVTWGEERGADMLSSSLGYTDWYHYYMMDAEHAPITKCADAATDRGMTVVVSAGNSGDRGIGAPAEGKKVISVGAVTDQGVIASFSSRGPSADGRIKPDVGAMGVRNFVASADNTTTYTFMSGTSFSCPLIGGAVALVLQAHPDWSPEQVYEAITNTASHPLVPDTLTGYGIVNTWAAIVYNPKVNLDTNCAVYGCSGHGGCCNGKCVCAPDHYGRFCQYTRVKCGTECLMRGGKCVIDQFGLEFVCGDATGPTHSNSTASIYEQCKACDSKFDVCGVCGGLGQSCLGCDGVPFSGKQIDTCGKCGGNGNCKAIIIDDEDDTDSSRLKIIIGSTVGGVGIILIVAAVVIMKKRFRNLTPFRPSRGYTQVQPDNYDLEGDHDVNDF